VLPLLQNEVVPPGWVTQEQFLAGYGAAQAVPGPLFTFAAYLGAVIASGPSGGDQFAIWPPNGITGALIALIAIFLPAFLVVFAALPSWGALRSRAWAQSALSGVNAGVVGLLLAALIGLVMSAIASLQ
jgi:chromate transporter